MTRRSGCLCFFIGLSLIFLWSPQSVAQGKLREKIREKLSEKREGLGGQESSSTNELKEVVLPYDGVDRYYYIHVPASYSKSSITPLVFAFHGGGGNGKIMANDEFYGWISKSEEAGFIVVFPTGASRFKGGKFATWNAGRCCGYARDQESDDVGFVGEILRDVRKNLSIDATRIFSVGMSNGGMFSYHLACAMPETFRAIASVAGTDNTPQCTISRGISVLHIHAKDDTHVLYNGGAGENAFRDRFAVTDFVSVPDTISKWTGLNLCPMNAQKILEVPSAYCEQYAGCRDGAVVELCVTENGGHSWPGARKTPMKKSSLPSQAINATDMIWEFFESSAP